MSTSLFPSYRNRYLPAMTAAQIAALPDKEWAPVIIATGAIEQHGPHLPVAVDSFLAQVWLERALPKLAADVSCYVAPPITLGKSNEHTGFPGTLIVSKDTLRALLLTIARQVQTWGFRNLAVLNTHGGNSAVITYTLREISATLGLRCRALAPKSSITVPPQEATYGYHANTFESAVMLAAVPQYVDMKAAVSEYCGSVDDPGELRPERAPATMAWITSDLSKSGIMGDATAATTELGHAWLDHAAEGFGVAIAEFCRSGKSMRQ
ncbi:MAG: creatininase family protein [Opitutus sp.]